MKSTVRFLLLVIVSLFACLSTAQAYTLSGTVYGGSTPMAGSTVTLSDANSGSTLSSTTSDSTGHYSFSVSAGTYNLLVVPPAGSPYANSPVNQIFVSANDVSQDIVLVSSSLTLSGVLRAPDGTALNQITLNVKDTATSQIVATQKTGNDGSYSFTLSTGTYSIDASGGRLIGNTTLVGMPYGFSISPIAANIALSSNQTLNLTVPFVRLSGKTTDSNGVAVPNVVLSTYQGNYWYNSAIVSVEQNATSYPTKSDANGDYVMWVFPKSDYTVTATPPNGSNLAPTVYTSVSVLSDTVRNFIVNPSLTLSGVLRAPDSTALNQITLNVKDAATNQIVATQKTGSDGSYSFTLAAGTYSINASGGRLIGNTTLVGMPYGFSISPIAANIALSSNQTLNLTVPFVRLSGKTTDSNGIAAPNVVLSTYQGNYSYNSAVVSVEHNATSYPTKSDANGNYVMWIFPKSDYAITVTPPNGSGMAPTVYSAVSVLGDTPKDFIANSSLTLSGVLRAPDGTVLNQITLTVKDTATNQTVVTQKTGNDGSYSFALSAGTYSINASGGRLIGNTTLVGMPYGFAISPIAANIALSSNQTLNLTVPFVRLSGKTTDSNGVAVPNVVLSTYQGNYSYNSAVVSIEHNATSYPTKSDANGDYVMWVFPKSDYSINVAPPSQSGFGATPVNGVSVTADKLLNVVLSKPDTIPPIILSGPLATQVGTTTATIVWQTDEPATGGANWGTGSASETGYRTQHAILLTGLSASTPYTVAVTSTDKSGNGPTTASLTFTTASLPDTTPPLIVSGPTVSALTHTSAVVEWETNEPASTQISGGVVASVAGLSTQHRVELTGLTAQTAYAINVSSSDTAANGPTTRSLGFTTLAAPDLTPPVITKGPWAVDVTADAATIVWETDEPANSGISFNDGTAYGVLNDDALTRQHSVRMTGLNASTNYNVTASSKDTFGNGPTLSSIFPVLTQAAVDTAAPVFVEAPHVCNINQQLIHLCFRTDEPASVVVEYGTAPDALTRTEARVQNITNHSIPINGLSAATTYYLRVKASDAAGNVVSSAVLIATTTGVAAPTNPQFVSAPSVAYTGKNRMVISWETDRPCNALVEYGQADYSLQVSDGKMQTKQQIVITNLAPGTSYQFRVKATDVDGNTVTSGF